MVFAPAQREHSLRPSLFATLYIVVNKEMIGLLKQSQSAFRHNIDPASRGGATSKWPTQFQLTDAAY